MNVLSTLDKGAIYFVKQDSTLFLLWYLQYVEGLRPDVKVISRNGLSWNGYLEHLKRGYRDLRIALPNPTRPVPTEYIDMAISDIINNNRDSCPIYWEPASGTDLVMEYLVPCGIVAKMERERVHSLTEGQIQYHYNLWDTYYAQFRGDKSFLSDKNAIEAYGASRSNMGNLFGKRGWIDLAIYEDERTLELNERFAETHSNLGGMYAKKGWHDKAEREYRCALELNPNLVEARNNIGNAYLERGLIDEAIGEYRRVLALNPNVAEAHYNLANAYMRKGEFERSIPEFEEAIRLSPNLIEAHNNLAAAYLKAKDFKTK